MKKTTISAILGVTLLVAGLLAIGFSSQDAFATHKPQKALAQVRDATTLEAEKGASCTFTFQPSGNVVGPVSANNGGIAKAKNPNANNNDTSVDVSCTDAAGNIGAASVPLKAHGRTVVPVLT